MSDILVVTASTLGDEGVTNVLAALARRGRRVITLDSARFPLTSTISVDLDGETWDDGVRHDLRDVGAVWHRHSDIGGALGDALDETWRDAVVRQSDLGIMEIAVDRDCLHVDHPDRAEAVPGAVGLLRLARTAGLDVPRTLVSNRPDDIRAFVASCRGGAVRKLLHSSSVLIQTEEGVQRGKTEAVSPDDLLHDASLLACPIVWQERVPKARELRITCVGRRLFVASVDSTRSEKGGVDWRQDPALVGSFAVDTLPPTVEAAIQRLLDRLRLNFATIDVIRTPDGRHVLLEVNTVSFFDFVERATGLPIAEEIAKLLAGEVEARVPRG